MPRHSRPGGSLRPLARIKPYLRLGAGWVMVLILTVVAVSCMSPGEQEAASPTLEDAPAVPATDPPETTTVPSTASPTTPGTTTAPTSPPSTAEPARFFVSPEGSDDNPGTEQEPWETFSHAVAQLEAGDTLIVADGTYRERVRVETRPGTADEPVTVQAAPEAEPIVQGLLWLYQPDYWIIDGINVTWDEEEGDDEEHMVKITDGVGWTLRNAELWGAESFAALLVARSDDGALSDWTVAGNCIHDTLEANDTNEDQLIYVNSGDEPTNGLIENNLIFGADNGSGVKLGGSSEDEGGAHAVTVRNNTILDAAQGILVAWGASDNVITGNLFAGTDEGYGHIRGYELSGGGNVASDNGGDDHRPFILNDEGYTGVADGGNNVAGLPVETSDLSCDFQPEGEAAGFGIQTELAAMPDG